MRRHQNGRIWQAKKNGNWYARWYQEFLVNGVIVRKRVSQKLADFCDRYRCERDVRPLLEAILRPINEGRSDARGTLLVTEYIEQHYLPAAEKNLKPSTFYGYSRIYVRYLSPHLGRVVLKDFTTADAKQLLHRIHQQTGVGKKHLRHIKSFLEAVFDVAISDGAIEGTNPLKVRTNNKVVELIPQDAASSKETGHSTLEDVLQMLALETLSLKARVAIALCFFAGLRPGEARGLRWEDFDGRRMHIRRSIWRKFETTPKTEGSEKAISVKETLRGILEDLRLAEGNPAGSAPILRGQVSGKPLSLDNIAWREVRPALKAAGIPWHGWYGLRRGMATKLDEVKGTKAASTLLRHSDVRTTTEHYIKADQEKRERELDEGLTLVEELCSGRQTTGYVQ